MITLASAGMLVTTAPEPVSLLLEPISLLLIPGTFVAILFGTGLGHLFPLPNGRPDARDFTNLQVVLCAALFYLVLFYLLLWRRDHRRRAEALLTHVETSR